MDSAAFHSWLDGWEPPASTVDDSMDPAPLHALAAALGRELPSGGIVPPLWHWLYFLRWRPARELGIDGHPTSGSLLPPIPERTRMFGGARIAFSAPLRCSVSARKHTSVVQWQVKEGRTGTMLFVTERHQVEQAGTVVLVEEQDVMYRSGPAPARIFAQASVSEPASSAPWQAPFRADPVLLFRFSALTANSHRIHYDWPYVTSVEGYPGLVVHGTLLAVAMAGLVAEHAPLRQVASVHFRLKRPVFAGERVLVTGHPDHRSAAVAIVGDDGEPRSTAEVEFA